MDGALLLDFKVNAALAFPQGLAARLETQLGALGIRARYKREINAYMNGQALSLHLEFARNQAAGVRRFLRAQALLESDAPLHPNHWKPVPA